jgi:hypothetical protein
VSLFFNRKSEEPSPSSGSPSTALIVAPSRGDASNSRISSPAASFPAPKASDLERQIRAVTWQHMSPQLAHAANLSLPELIDWTSGVTRLSTPQIEALARKMGLLDTPVTGVDAIRARLNVALKKRPDFTAHIEWPRGQKGEEELRAFAAGEDCLTLDELNKLAKEFWGLNFELDPETLLLRSTNTHATSLGCGPAPYTGGSNVPGINEKMIQSLQARRKELQTREANAG